MKRSGRCRKCGATIRPSAKDMSVAAASRIHYWRHHPEVMLAGQAKRRWSAKTSRPGGVRGRAAPSAGAHGSKRRSARKRARGA